MACLQILIYNENKEVDDSEAKRRCIIISTFIGAVLMERGGLDQRIFVREAAISLSRLGDCRSAYDPSIKRNWMLRSLRIFIHMTRRTGELLKI